MILRNSQYWPKFSVSGVHVYSDLAVAKANKFFKTCKQSFHLFLSERILNYNIIHKRTTFKEICRNLANFSMRCGQRAWLRRTFRMPKKYLKLRFLTPW